RQLPRNLPKLDNQPAHFGYSLGLNLMDFTLKPSAEFYTFDTVYAVENRSYVGFNINMIANLRLTQYLDFRFNPGLNFGQRDLEYKLLENGVFKKHVMRIESTFLDFPMLFKYRSERYNNFRPYLIGGGSIRYDLAAQKKIDPEDSPKIKLNPMDAYYEIGLGVDFFLEYFMFAVEVKGSFGALNAVNYDNTEYSTYFEKLNSKMLIISFHFEGGKIDKISWFME
ncbi:MAG: porin family protein, partial [Candidatus Delongbacteria bacterium]|nr:porin family protein [Candidatus Delongbacteria bacterium]